MNGQKLAAVDLDSTLSRSANIDDEVAYCVARSSAAFGRLKENVWERRGLSVTKPKVYRAVVLPSLLYACEMWTLCSHHAKKINGFHMKCLRSLPCIK
jgi:hypothetical protein